VVQPPTGEDCAAFFAADGDVSSLATLLKVQAEGDVGLRPLFARYLHCIGLGRNPGDPNDPGPGDGDALGIGKSRPGTYRPADAGRDFDGLQLPTMMISGTRARGIYCTLPQAGEVA